MMRVFVYKLAEVTQLIDIAQLNNGRRTNFFLFFPAVIPPSPSEKKFKELIITSIGIVLTDVFNAST